MYKGFLVAAVSPLIIASGLMALPRGAGTGMARVRPAVAPLVRTSAPAVPLYPGSERIAGKTLVSLFGFPVGAGVKDASSPVYRLPVPAATAESWYTRMMEQRGYRLVSRGYAAQDSSAVTQGLEFAKGVEDTQQAGLSFQETGPGSCDMQYSTVSITLPVRPASTEIASPRDVRQIAVVYRAWRYGSPSQHFSITNHREIARVVRILNALPPSIPMPEHCAADFGQGATLTVEFANHRQWVVRDNAACDSVRIPGAPPLTDVGGLLYRTLGQDRPKG